jgi:hypothetical protein
MQRVDSKIGQDATLMPLSKNTGSGTKVDKIEAQALPSVSSKNASTRRHASLAASSR